MQRASTLDGTPSDDDVQILASIGFYWREREGVRVLVSRPLEDAGFTNGFSTRLGGVSAFPADALNLAGFDEDSAENIGENRRRFLRALGGEWQLATVWQVHGDTVRQVGGREDAELMEVRADAVVSDQTGILAGVKTADCVPVLLGDPTTGAFAAVHAGWRGTVKSIVAKAVKQLIENYRTNPRDLICAIGPAATCQSYEVGPEVVEAFSSKFGDSPEYFTPTREGHALVDLHAANRNQLLACGLNDDNIQTAPYCTMERTDLFFSYRQESKKYGRTGRLLSVIGMKPK